jgi:Cu/Ag efflux protein CusF
MRVPRRGCVLMVIAGVAVSILPACTAQDSPKTDQPTAATAETAKKAFAFAGTVSAVDAAAKTLTVKGDSVEGWMAAMTMSYKADKDDIFGTVKPGDRITATVYAGDFQTLYDVRVAQAEAHDSGRGQ